MLDAFIIEEIKRQEESKRHEERERPRPRLPVPDDTPRPTRQGGEDGVPDRGVVIIDYSI